MRVVVLGATGMLGSMVLGVMAQEPALDLVTTVRSRSAGAGVLPAARGEVQVLDVLTCQHREIEAALKSADWAINCIGLIKPYIHDTDPRERAAALRINAEFPWDLAQVAEQVGCQVLQVATDCVYAGTRGAYVESDPHDSWDVYGKTKSLGEIPSKAMHHLRCSIIGPENKGRTSLLEWFLGQPRNGRVQGFTDHLWNGVTTLHFARICRGILQNGPALPGLCHVVPGSRLSKGQMLQAFAGAYRREDLEILLAPAPSPIDRTLATNQPDLNASLWKGAGYDAPPTLESMIEELSTIDRQFRETQP
jgi:dTDP-4-dehydrorhamnose reductase